MSLDRKGVHHKHAFSVKGHIIYTDLSLPWHRHCTYLDYIVLVEVLLYGDIYMYHVESSDKLLSFFHLILYAASLLQLIG